MKKTGDWQAARELFNYLTNDRDLYRQRVVPIVNNLKRKLRKGVYNPPLAKKLWKYAADDAAKKYTKEYGSGVSFGIFDVPTRKLTAELLENHYFLEVKKPEMWNNPKGKRMARRKSSKRPSRKQLAARRRFAAMARSGALKRRRNHVSQPRSRATRRAVRAASRSHPHFSKLPIHVQEQRSGAWHTVAGFTVPKRATDYAHILKRHVGRVPVRVVDVR